MFSPMGRRVVALEVRGMVLSGGLRTASLRSAFPLDSFCQFLRKLAEPNRLPIVPHHSRNCPAHGKSNRHFFSSSHQSVRRVGPGESLYGICCSPQVRVSDRCFVEMVLDKRCPSRALPSPHADDCRWPVCKLLHGRKVVESFPRSKSVMQNRTNCDYAEVFRISNR